MSEREPQRKTGKKLLALNLPPKETIIDELTQAEIYGFGEFSDTITDLFIERVENRKNGYIGLVLDWQMAIAQGIEEVRNSYPDYVPTIEHQLDRHFYHVIDTIVSDPHDRAVTKEYMMDFERTVKKKK